MSDVKHVKRLEDWFDAVIVLGAAGPWAAVLSNRSPVYVVMAEPRAQDVTQVGSQGGRFDISAPAEPGAARAEGLRRFIHGRQVKRPLLIITDDAFADIVERMAEPFKVYAGSTHGPVSDRCDMVETLDELEAVEQAVVAAINARSAAYKKLNVLVLYNDAYTHIASTREHLKAFADLSRHNYFFFPAAETVAGDDPRQTTFADYQGLWPQAWDLDVYDAVIWHYVLPAYKGPRGHVSDYIAQSVIGRLASYDGLKILFVQDEYDNTATIWESIARAGVHLVMTVVPEPSVRYAYPRDRTPGVEFISTLTGFAPIDDGHLRLFALPLAERELRIGYRGRVLPYRYGSLAREKVMIGERMRELAAEREVRVDIEMSEDKRIYGEDWYRFLGSCRATLATESGSNVFDFDGALAALEHEDELYDYEDFYTQHLAAREREAQMNQISPKIFEAIALKTPLICFEGEYSGIIQPDLHFIPLKKDFSNAAAVFARLEDLEGLEAMAERAYRDVIASGRFGYSAFIKRFDRIVETRVVRPSRAEIISAPIAWRRRGLPSFEPIVRARPFETILNTGVLYGNFQRRDLEDAMGAVREAELSPYRLQGKTPPADGKVMSRFGPEAVICYEYWQNAGARLDISAAGAALMTPAVAWHYAAGVHLDLSMISFETEHCWIRIALGDVSGSLLVSLYDAGKDSLAFESEATPGDATHDLVLRIADARGSLLLFRTGPYDKAASATILGVEVIVASAFHPQIAEAARRMLDDSPTRA